MKRDTKNAMLGGVCAGLAKATETDVLLWRIGFALLTLAGFSLGFWIYLLLWILTEKE